ncbi:unnamed protein product [Owenia fusiformis]|uniref:Copine-3 n=1 Tax=Owenia fusiformis TaxID=6347 RepID=A0A8J1UT42_OWEFU|nr:unnamed protein product [Owenia fusiformis]
MAVPAGTNQCLSRVEIRISCSHLVGKDVLSKSDPCAVVMMETKGKYHEIGRTEQIKNCHDPEFTKTFEVDYFFEEVQKLRIAVYDIDNQTSRLDDDDFLGQLDCTLGQVVSNSPFTRPLQVKQKSDKKSTITIFAEEIQGSNDVVQLSFRAEKLDKKDFLSKSDPYLEFCREAANGKWVVVHRTEVVDNNLNPQWKPFELPIRTLCGGHYDKVIKVICYDYDDDGSHDLIGEFSTKLSEMIDCPKSWDCINPKKKAKKKSYKNSGVVHCTSCKVVKVHSFLDYIFGGLQINITFGIDFTASNGNPATPQSLHYINPYEPNEYMKAIQAVGNVIQDYDSDKMFPCLGFGARVPPKMEVSHEFACNFNLSNPFCAGIQGVVQTYTACISQVQLYGPTNASPVIYHVAQFAAAAQKEPGAKSYCVLLLITDGVITDMNETRQAIVYASHLPMSLIIVGVGNADFTDMNVLDGDNGVLRGPSGDPVKRDIVQFVPFRDFRNASPAELARHVLAEVPQQVVKYFKMHGIPPNVRPQ